MVDIETAYHLVNAMPQIVEAAHFDKVAYKIKGKIFATLNIEALWFTIKLTAEQQIEYCEWQGVIPVPNKWGKQGWTHILLADVSKPQLTELLNIAYQNIKAL